MFYETQNRRIDATFTVYRGSLSRPLRSYRHKHRCMRARARTHTRARARRCSAAVHHLHTIATVGNHVDGQRCIGTYGALCTDDAYTAIGVYERARARAL